MINVVFLWFRCETLLEPKEKKQERKNFIMSAHIYRFVDGVYLSRNFYDDDVRSAMAYEPEEGDVFLVSYPKCGSMWMQFILYYLNNEDAPFLKMPEMMSTFSPFLEYTGADTVRKMAGPKLIKTHLPCQVAPFSDRAKYVVVTRNPYDCCVSFYHHTKASSLYQFSNGTFDEFFDMFVEGNVDFGNYFDHLMSWYSHRNEPNVMFITYEELKSNTRGSILKVAEFLGEQYVKKLKNDPEVLEMVLPKTNFENTKQLNMNKK